MPAQHESLATGPAATERETMAAETKSVYLSSTLLDMAATREKIDRFFTKFGWTVKQSYDTDPWLPVLESCLEDVRTSDVYVAVVGFRYGTEMTHSASGLEKSITEHEFDAAVESTTPCHVYLLSGDAACVPNQMDENQAKVKAFRAGIGLQRRSCVYSDLSDLITKLVWVIKPETQPLDGTAADPHLIRLPPLPSSNLERQQAIDRAAVLVFASLANIAPNAAKALKTHWQADAGRDRLTAAWALNNLTAALESATVVGLVPALKAPDHGQFSAAVKLLMRLYVCRGFSDDGWQRLRGLRSGGLLQINDLWLLHAGAQAAVGLDFDLPDLNPGPHPAAPTNRYLHELLSGLSAGLGADEERQIEGEMVRKFPDFTLLRPSTEAGIDALLDWRADLAAHVENRGQIDNRSYAVAQQVVDDAAAAELASATRPFGVLPLAYAVKREDAYLGEPFRVLLSALKLCQTALHKLTPSTHQP